MLIKDEMSCKRLKKRIVGILSLLAALIISMNFGGTDGALTVEAAASDASLYGFSVQSYASTDTYKTYAVRRNDDGTNTYTAEFLCDAEESWIDSDVTFEVEDVTPEAYKKLFEDVGVASQDLDVTVSSDADYIKKIHAMGYTVNITTPFTEDGGGFEGDAVSGKVITVEAGPSTKVVKVSAIKDGEVIDYIYVGSNGKDSSGSYSEYDLALYQQVRQYVESRIWTDDMTNLEKIAALADYISKTTHYPNSDTTEKENNPTFWENWSVDDEDLYYNMFNDVIMNRIMDLQGGIVSCLAAQILNTAAQEDLGLPYLYDSSTGLVADGEGVWLVSGSYSSNPSNPYHYSLKYQSASGTTALIDAQGVSYSASSGKASCEAHGCGDYIVDLDFTFDAPAVDISTCTISLSGTSLKYDGKAQTPSVTVTSGNKTLTKGIDYTVGYSNNKNAGTATVTITGKGSYTGTITKTFTIAKAAQTVTAKAASSSIKAGKTTTITASGTGTITYSSSDTSVATVDSSGKVKGVGAGTATITVKAAGNSNYNSATKTVTITVGLSTATISSVKQSKTTVTIKWSKITGAEGYYVYRSTSKSGGYKRIATVTGSTYKDTASKSNGKTYYYKVKAYSGSTTGSASSAKSIKYMKATVSSLTNTSSGIKVKWKEVSGATGYYIYRKSSSATKYTLVATITKGSTVSYTDTSVSSGKTYSYKVYAYASTGRSAASSAKSIKYLAPGKISSLTNTSDGITVKWSKVAGASGYYVYRKTASGTYKKIATVGKSTTSYTDTAVKSKNGTTYYYCVKAYSGSTTGSYTGKKTVRLTAVKLSSATNSASKTVTVKVSAKNAKATGYQIQYSTSSTFASGNKTVKITSASTLSKKITGLTKGKTYYVRVRAYKTVDDTTYYSAWSSKKSVKVRK